MNREILVCVAAAALASVAAVVSAAEKPGDYNDTYGVMDTMNMFVRDRQPPRPRNVHTPRPPSVDHGTPEMVQKDSVLRGVTIEGAELRAYLENTHTGQISRLAPGDAVASGRVSDIAIDAIAFELNGKTTWVSVGENLAGGRSTETPLPTTAPSYAPAKPGVPAPLPPGGGSLEERMRARRAAQTQKK